MYEKILLATDLSAQAEQILARAHQLAEQIHSELHIAHVVEPMSVNYSDALVVDFSSVQNQVFQQAEERLKSMAKTKGIAPERCHTLTGRTEPILCECVEQIGADLLMLGGQPNTMMRTLFGSTGVGILRGIPCDLLYIRLEA